MSDSRGWVGQGLCAQTDPEVFFGDESTPTRIPKRICAACPVRAECLDWALDHNEKFGVWGGLNATERRRLRRNRTEHPTTTNH